jgi:hypothetical protein
VDATGVGRPVVEMLRESSLQAYVRGYTITAGFNEGEYKDGIGTVPKLHLCARTQGAVQQRRVKYAEGIPLGRILEKEMETFQVKVTENRNETFAAWREKDHDDLVLALALIIWYGEQTSFGGYDLATHPVPRNTIREQIAEKARRREQRVYPPYLRDGPTTGW